MSFFYERYRFYLNNLIVTDLSLPANIAQQSQNSIQPIQDNDSQIFSLYNDPSFISLKNRILELGLTPTIYSASSTLAATPATLVESPQPHSLSFALTFDPNDFLQKSEPQNVLEADFFSIIQRDLDLLLQISELSDQYSVKSPLKLHKSELPHVNSDTLGLHPHVDTNANTEKNQILFQKNSSNNLYSDNSLVMFNKTVSLANTLSLSTCNYPLSNPAGLLIPEIKTVSSINSQKKLIINQLVVIKQSIIDLNSRISATLDENKKPGLLTRSWVPLLTLGLTSYYTLRTVIGYTDSIKAYFYQLVKVSLNYTYRYILDPLKEAYKTIRYGGRIITVVSSSSLDSSINALQLMVVSLLASEQLLTDHQIQDIKDQVKTGDISMVMGKYAKEIKNPIKNALFGDLIPSILVQVQKANVDIQNTLAALDKLLRSNELNFVFLAVAPAMAILYSFFKIIASIVNQLSANVDNTHTGYTLKCILREIDILLNQQLKTEKFSISQIGSIEHKDIDNENDSKQELAQVQKQYIDQGTLLCYSDNLRYFALCMAEKNSTNSFKTGYVFSTIRKLIFGQGVGIYSSTIDSKNVQNMVLADIRDLENCEFSFEQRYNVLQRIYRTWDSIFK
ncbi:hypothetical protein BB561_002282 [Smittium simulii]|uniref:Nuclear control of ATPase protein 2 n=1 Tax=Smittium simulii TaxID=133385 RepID=A0A2T9YQX5_9FUNG|nr:hypothetical protein BB561_002282 [Smittium simulii]